MTKKYRNEWKYHINSAQIATLQSKLKSVMDSDTYGDEGNYVVKSLYFDDYLDTCLKDNLGGESKRYKYRIRYYEDDTSFLRLERKEKYNTYCHKDSCLISHEDFKKIIEGDVSDFLYYCEKPLLKLFSTDILNRYFKPKIIIEYERIAYIEPISNIRITFDRNISCSSNVDDFLIGDYFKIPIMKKDEHVLEVKFDDILPSNYKNIIESTDIIQTSNSKYGMGRMALGRFK